MLKLCSTCKIEFNALATAKNCLNCRKEANRLRKNARSKVHYIENRERILKYHRQYEKTPQRKKTYQKFRSTEKYREYARNRYHKMSEQKKKARYFVTNAIRDGKIIRPEICERCKNKGRIEAHHHKGYSIRHWLDIQWLCTPCHKLIERKEKNVENS